MMRGQATVSELTASLYDPGAPPAALAASLQGIGELGVTIRGAVVLFPGTPMDAVAGFSGTGPLRVVPRPRQGKGLPTTLDLSRLGPGGQSEAGKARLAASPAQQVFYVYTTETGRFWAHVAAYWIDRAYPHVAQVSLRTVEMEEAMRRLLRATNASPEEFRITEFTYRCRLDGARSRRQQESARTWTDLSIDQAFEQLYELDASLERVRFELPRHGERSCTGSLSRRLEFAITGEFALFQTAVLEPAAEIADQRNASLSQRQRDAGNRYEARPFFIEYDTDILEPLEARQRLIAALARMRKAGHSTLHGNPYIHVSLLDYLEETSCDVYVLSPNRITVVPQTSSTPTALERLYSHICAEFAEGRIVDFSEVATDD